MARIRITRDTVEIEARLRSFITRAPRLDSKISKQLLAAISGLAYLYKVEMGPIFYTLIRNYFGYMPKSEFDTSKPPTESQLKPEEPENKPLTPEPISGILDGLEDDDGDKD